MQESSNAPINLMMEMERTFDDTILGLLLFPLRYKPKSGLRFFLLRSVARQITRSNSPSVPSFFHIATSTISPPHYSTILKLFCCPAYAMHQLEYILIWIVAKTPMLPVYSAWLSYSQLLLLCAKGLYLKRRARP